MKGNFPSLLNGSKLSTMTVAVTYLQDGDNDRKHPYCPNCGLAMILPIGINDRYVSYKCIREWCQTYVKIPNTGKTKESD